MIPHQCTNASEVILCHHVTDRTRKVGVMIYDDFGYPETVLCDECFEVMNPLDETGKLIEANRRCTVRCRTCAAEIHPDIAKQKDILNMPMTP
jgi:hypothetical protein